jgi:hypothetical protein
MTNDKRGGSVKVFWSVLLERSVVDCAVNSLLDVATTTATIASQRISVPYGRVDMARNAIVDMFLRLSTSSEDVLVMLDNDHVHPHDVIVQLVKAMRPPTQPLPDSQGEEYGVIGAAYRRRKEPYDWLAFRREEPRVIPGMQARTLGNLVALKNAEITGEIVPVDMIATGAIAIRRNVFEVLRAVGPAAPWFRYAYQDQSMDMPSEDMYFSAVCEWAGVPMACHTGIVSKHVTTVEI